MSGHCVSFEVPRAVLSLKVMSSHLCDVQHRKSNAYGLANKDRFNFIPSCKLSRVMEFFIVPGGKLAPVFPFRFDKFFCVTLNVFSP